MVSTLEFSNGSRTLVDQNFEEVYAALAKNITEVKNFMILEQNGEPVLVFTDKLTRVLAGDKRMPLDYWRDTEAGLELHKLDRSHPNSNRSSTPSASSTD